MTATPISPRRFRRGFTLVEIMIVVGIIGLMAAAGLPSMIRMIRPDPLRNAVRDVVEGCNHARAQAILRGVPMSFVIRAEDGALSVREVEKTPESESSAVIVRFGAEPPPAPAVGPSANYSARLHDDVAVELLDVNFVDHMKAPEASVKFYPNGTCDDFTIVLSWDGGMRKISTDLVTGHSEVEVLR